MRRYRIWPGAGPESLEIEEVPTPSPGRGQVLVRLRAASLNFRDLMIARGLYPGGSDAAIVPLSDGAGEVVALGEGCSRFAAGDRVAGIFMQSWLGGRIVDADLGSALGGAIDGVLTEYRLFDESGLVHLPNHLSFEEGATLPCAAVTVWNALFGLRPLRPGEVVLTLGTGGVSTFAIQFARAAGARVIATSSDDGKLERARELGATDTVNYRTTPDWEARVRQLTDGRGVDLVVETGGPGTLQRSIAATARDGVVHMIGVLSMGQIDPLPVLTGGVVVRGLMVGSREMFEAMNAAMAIQRIHPCIDKVFAFEEAGAAHSHLAVAGHVGKVVIAIG